MFDAKTTTGARSFMLSLKRRASAFAMLLLLAGFGWTGGQVLQSAVSPTPASASIYDDCEHNDCNARTQECRWKEGYECRIEIDGNCEDEVCQGADVLEVG
jgi:hypothetical protein